MDLNLKPGICSNGNGDNISPITSTSTVYRNNKKLDDILADIASIEPLNEEGIIISVENESIEEVLNSIHDNTKNIKTSLGSTTDVGGTNNSGTINAKLNKIITNTENINFEEGTEILNKLGTSDDTSSSSTIFGKLTDIKDTITTKFTEIISNINGVNNKIGNTEDSNGTPSTGGIFAKINKLLTDWTTARASKIDSIYTNTEPSTSSSSTGTLSQKLNYIKSLIETLTTKTEQSSKPYIVKNYNITKSGSINITDVSEYGTAYIKSYYSNDNDTSISIIVDDVVYDPLCMTFGQFDNFGDGNIHSFAIVHFSKSFKLSQVNGYPSSSENITTYCSVKYR